jgi:hypothetical protein
MGKVFFEIPAQASLLGKAKNAFTSNVTKVKNQMKNAVDEFKKGLENVAAVKDDLLSDISRSEDKDIIRVKFTVLKEKVKNLREIMINNMYKSQLVYNETYKELAMKEKTLREYSNPNAFWLKDGGLEGLSFRGKSEKIKGIESQKAAYKAIIDENMSRGDKIKQMAKWNASLPFSVCCRLIEKDCEELSSLQDAVSGALADLKSSLDDTRVFSGDEAINEIHKKYRALEVSCALLSQKEFFDDILGVREWRN